MLPLLLTMEEPVPVRDLEDLLSRIQLGEQDALAALYDRCRAAVYALALSFLKHHEKAQDLTQDVFVQIWEKAESYRPQGSPMAWILTVTRNLCKMSLRKDGRTQDMEPEEWDLIPAAEALSPEDREVLHAALKSLQKEELRIVLLHAVSGLRHREIAGVLGLPLPTVLSRYHRALKKLKAKLEGDEKS